MYLEELGSYVLALLILDCFEYRSQVTHVTERFTVFFALVLNAKKFRLESVDVVFVN
jgi:hypothetical protein